MNLSIGDKVKLNPEIFPKDQRNNDKFQAGKINYFALMLKWELKVVKSFTDKFHGDMIELEVCNQSNVKSTVNFIKEDCILIEE